MKLIYEVYVGSTLYNLTNSNSDKDLKGLYLPTRQELLGLHNRMDKPKSTESIEDNIKVEKVYYPFAHFMNLVLKFNPTVLELAFAEDKYKTITTPVSNEIMEFIRSNMICKEVFAPYYGYIKDQLKIVEGKRASNSRANMIEKYGYDIKASSHVYRLTVQLHELLERGSCNPTMQGEQRETCLKIKNGLCTFEKTIDILHKQVVMVKEDEAKSTLKETVEFDLVNNFVVNIHEKVIKETS